jgi:hypothetical protein
MLEQSPPGMDANEVGRKMVGVEGVEEVHDLHVWTITSGFPALAAYVLVGPDEDCHERRRDLEELLEHEFGIEHTTLWVDHMADHGPTVWCAARAEEECGPTNPRVTAMSSALLSSLSALRGTSPTLCRPA